MAAQLLLHSKGLSWKSRGGCRCQSYSSALQPLNRNTWAGLKEREVGWRERGEGGEECLLETEEEKSYSARSLLKHSHPPPAPQFRIPRGRAAPSGTRVPWPPAAPAGTARSGFPLFIALRHLLEPTSPVVRFLFILKAFGCQRHLWMSIGSHTNRGKKRHKITVFFPSPTHLELFLYLFISLGFFPCFISDFSTPKPKLCALRWSCEAEMPPRWTLRGTSSPCRSLCQTHLNPLVQHKQCGRSLRTPKPRHRLAVLCLETTSKSHKNL